MPNPHPHFEKMKSDAWDFIINKNYEEAARTASNALMDSFALDQIHIAGLSLTALDRVDEGYEWLCASLCLAAGRPDWFANAAMAMIDKKHYLQAMIFLRNGTEEFPKDIKLSYMKGLCLCHMQEWHAAIPALEDTLALDPTFYHANMSKGFCMHMLGRYDEALECYEKIEGEQEPDLEEAINNRACVLMEMFRQQEALDLLNTRYPNSTRPGTMFNKALFNLGLGNWKEGWKLYRARQMVEVKGEMGVPEVDQPLATKLEDIRDKHLFLFHEQGLGDGIQFVRYAKLIRPLVKRLTIGAPKGSKRLFETMDLGAPFDVITEASLEDPVYTECDIAMPMMDAPAMFETTLETIPEFGPYFTVPSEIIDQRQLPDACKPFVGLVWAGASRPENLRAHNIDSRRSIAYSVLEPLLELTEYVQFVSIQMPDQRVDDPRILQPLREHFDVLDTAGVIAQLDLVISIDSSMCHLAAALGKPTWMLSRYDSCWRWQWDGRTDTPFYPTMRIFRQKAHHTWPAVIDEVAEALKERVTFKAK